MINQSQTQVETRQCVICEASVTKSEFTRPPERTVCNNRSCVAKLIHQERGVPSGEERCAIPCDTVSRLTPGPAAKKARRPGCPDHLRRGPRCCAYSAAWRFVLLNPARDRMRRRQASPPTKPLSHLQ